MKTPSPRARRLPAVQPRAERTAERILDATELLLGRVGAEALSVDEIAAAAHVSVGAFYKRYTGKQALLPALLSRMQQRALAAPMAYRADSGPLDLLARFDALIVEHIEAYRHSRVALRSLVVAHWQDPGAFAAARNAAIELSGRVMRWLLERRAEIGHPMPERALAFSLGSTLQTLQAALLFEAFGPEPDLDVLRGELNCQLRSYLMLRGPRDTPT